MNLTAFNTHGSIKPAFSAHRWIWGRWKLMLLFGIFRKINMEKEYDIGL
jgi:hypothetical protein